MKPLDQIIEWYDIQRDKINADFINNRFDSDEYKLRLSTLREATKARILSVMSKWNCQFTLWPRCK